LQAQRLLETSDYSVDEVAGRCGFRSPVALRGHFRRQLGSSPAAYRAAYRARRPQSDPDRTSILESVVPAQAGPGARRPQAGPGGPSAMASAGAELGKPAPEAYAAGHGRPSLPGQRSVP
jgi:hypothetical protein